MRGACVPPGPSAGGGRLAGTLRSHSQCDELSIAGLGFAPLLPQNLAAAPAQPLIQQVERLPDRGEPKVAHPSSREEVDLLDHLKDVSPPPLVGDLAYPILRPFHGAGGGLQARRAVICHRVAQKLPFPGSCHGALCAIHLQTQLGIQVVRQPRGL